VTHAATREQALEAQALHQRYPAEVQSCQACGDTHLAHYASPGSPPGCVACEAARRACPVFVPGALPYPLAKHLDPVSEDPGPCPWLCGHEVSAHGGGRGCLRCGCAYTGEPGTSPPGSITYHGYPAGGHSGRLVVIEAPAGTPVSLLPHVSHHSPTGMSWGYGGSGPADLARSLLIAALGPAAACPECRGTGKVTYDGDGQPVPCGTLQADESDPESVFPCDGCEDGYRQLPHQNFKAATVARWDPEGEWVFSRAQLLQWLRAADPGAYAAAIAVLPEDA